MQTMKKTIQVGVASAVSPSDVVFGPTARMVTLVPTTTPACPAGCSQTANMEISAILYTLSASLMPGETVYLRIICRYIFLKFWLKTQFMSTKFCDLFVKMVYYYTVSTNYSAYISGYKILCFGPFPEISNIISTCKK